MGLEDMNATRKGDWVVLSAAGVTLVGAAAAEPALSLAAASVAALATTVRRLRLASHVAPRSGARRQLADIAESPALRAFEGHESAPASPDKAEDGTGDADDDADDAERGSRAYEEFAAGLEEEDDEDISFLPPYVSGESSQKRSQRGPNAREGGGDTLLASELADSDPPSKMPVPRRFALGTVAIIRKLLEPADVERILAEQRRYPRLRFGDVAVQLGLLTAGQLQELLVAQEEGVFSDEEIADARSRLAEYHGSSG